MPKRLKSQYSGPARSSGQASSGAGSSSLRSSPTTSESSPAHTHPGDCVGTVVDGQIELRALGKDVRRVQAGEAFGNTRGTVHQFVNTSDKPVRMVTTLVVVKGKPRTMMQPDFK